MRGGHVVYAMLIAWHLARMLEQHGKQHTELSLPAQHHR
jgi:hypothetical protein